MRKEVFLDIFHVTLSENQREGLSLGSMIESHASVSLLLEGRGWASVVPLLSSMTPRTSHGLHSAHGAALFGSQSDFYLIFHVFSSVASRVRLFATP